MARVCVVGSVNSDLVFDVAALPGPGETVLASAVRTLPGGKGGNQAVAAARLGAQTSFVGAVGNDAFGEQARAALAAEGIDLTGLAVADAATGVALILVDEHGENSIAVASGANGAVTPVHVRAALAAVAIGAGDVVLVGHEIPTESAREALAIGRAAGATTILNPAPATGLSSEILEAADIVTPNEGELATLAGLASGPGVGDAVAALRSTGVSSALVVSLGAAGAHVDLAGSVTALPALAVDAVDAVGAGDTLNGALAAGLASGLPLEQAAQRAVVAASLAVTKTGAREGMPTTAELEAALAI